jgi:signal peptidase II
MKNNFSSYKVFWWIFLCVLVLDQLTKYLIQLVQHTRSSEVFFSVWGWLSLVYVRNTGAAWGVMAGSGTVLGILAILALLTIFVLRKALQIKRFPMQIAFGLLSAGIAGNMIDRLFLGYVVDFVDCDFNSWRFPAFNIADAGISIGVGIYIAFSLLEWIGQQKKSAAVSVKE